jgi:hypothetical protein
MTRAAWFDVVGWYGVVALLTAYALLSLGYLDGSGLFYQLLNFTGALGILVEASAKRDFEPVVLNVVWAGIAGFTIMNILF